LATPVPSPAASPLHNPPVDQRLLLVHQDDQTMFVYENNIVVRTIPVSTGAPVTNMFTPPWQGIVGDDWGSGPFRNQQWADFMWYLFPGPEGSILIHSVPYTIHNNIKVYDRAETLGVQPVSNGCIRISPEDAAWLKSWNPVGVPITITRWSGQIQPPDPGGEETKNE
jgi:lipoprotein-anchoring transpeptidase ErfK/SrfK